MIKYKELCVGITTPLEVIKLRRCSTLFYALADAVYANRKLLVILFPPDLQIFAWQNIFQLQKKTKQQISKQQTKNSNKN